MVLAGISVAARTELVFIENGTMNGDWYIEECIIPHVIPYAQFIGNAFQLMHDNARANTARIVSDVLNEVEINVMDWQACSPDLNPIENVWDILQKRVSRRVDVPETVHELRVHLQEEWYSIPQADILEAWKVACKRSSKPEVAIHGSEHEYRYVKFKKCAESC